MRQLDFFSRPPETGSRTWQFPRLYGSEIVIDVEATGANTLSDDVLGLAVRDNHAAYYLPVAHREGSNLDQEKFRLWCADTFAGKDLIMAYAKYDIKMLKRFGVDLERIGARPHDIQHAVALLDSKRRSYKVDDLAESFLGLHKLDWDHSKNRYCSAEEIEAYALQDAELTWQLHNLFADEIDKEDLAPVLELEDSIIYAVVEMETNAVRIDVEKLEIWNKQVNARYVRKILELSELAGFRVEPKRPKSLAKLYKMLGVAHKVTEKGGASFSADNMRLEDHPTIKLALEARELRDFSTNFTGKYLKFLRDGHLYYNLNQLKSDDYGTVTGRFSSSGDRTIGGINIQQVYKLKDDTPVAIRDFPLRDIFIPDPGFTWCSADAAQIEFRLFAHYSGSKDLQQAYADNPLIDFHQIVAEMIHKGRYETKRINFGKLYGMGIAKLADSLGISQSQAKRLAEEYDTKFPQAKVLLKKVAKLAETRGWVKTLMGRRRRYDRGESTHSALNAVIQGTAADVMKIKLKAVYDNRKHIGIHKLRTTIHDELNMDIPKNEGCEQRLQEILDDTPLNITIPILWDVGVGETWHRAG